MNLPKHRRIDQGRTHASVYSEYCGIEHTKATRLWARLLGWLVCLSLFAFLGLLLAWRG